MRSLLKVLMLTILLVSFLAAEDFFLAGHEEFDPADTEDVRYGTSGHRGLTADADLDGDGKKEIYAKSNRFGLRILFTRKYYTIRTISMVSTTRATKSIIHGNGQSIYGASTRRTK